MSLFLKFLIMLFLASITTKAELAVTSRRYLIQGKGMTPSLMPVIERDVDSYLTCAMKCSLDQRCMSFYYGKSKCGLYYSREMTLKSSPDFNYYYHRKEPGVCEICPYGAENLVYTNGNSSFVVCPNKATFPEATDACSCVGGRLVYIPDAATQAFVYEIMKDQKRKGISLDNVAWIGIRGSNTPSYQWYHNHLDGKKATYLPFCSGEPNAGGEIGLAVYTDYDSSKWVDEPVLHPHSYICEYVENTLD